jgi:hypothetical protein
MPNVVDTRIRIWCVTALLTLAAGGVAYAQRPATKPTRAPRPRLVEHRPAAPAPPRRSPAFSV